jgi:hypothetical protein
MGKILLIGSFAVLPLLATSIQQQPACSTAPLSTYLGSAGCDVGGFTFENFKWVQIGGVSVNPADVTVTPQASGGTFGLDFSSTKFFVEGDNNIIYLLDYTIDPPPPVIDRMSMRLNANSPVPPGTATITLQLCAGDLFANNCAGGIGRQLSVFDNGGTNTKLFDSFVFPKPVSLVDIRTTIDLEANGASSEITGVSQTPTAIRIDTPEPASMALSGMGFAFVLLLARSRSRRVRAKLG